MEPRFRAAYNAAFSQGAYERYAGTLREQLQGEPGFGLAETPVFFRPDLSLAANARRRKSSPNSASRNALAACEARCRRVTTPTGAATPRSSPSWTSGSLAVPTAASYRGRDAGVNVRPTRATSPRSRRTRAGWCVQEKIPYADVFATPEGDSVKVEVRVLLVRPDDAPALLPAINLCRLSRGDMIGVDFNRDRTWVGSSIGLWAS